ncbi:MAG: hypothetical protein LQ340_004664 [Diploschistes diacapsis]|nr:MAG: hypothetical protein LQ340_004664 [Diploschistes diacapsis]
MSLPLCVLVTLATGTIGRALTHHLLSLSFRVRCLTRFPSSPTARALQLAGATLVQGDLNDAASLTTACAGVEAVFLNLLPTFDEPMREVQHARAVLEAARKAGSVRAVVYAGVVSGGGQQPHPDRKGRSNADDAGMSAIMVRMRQKAEGDLLRGYFEAKQATEMVVRKELEWLAGRWTVLRLSFFMNNFLPRNSRYYFPELREGVLRSGLPEGEKMMLTAPDDVAAVVERVLMDPETWAGRILNVGSQALGMREIGQELGEAGESDVRVEMVGAEEAAEEIKRGNVQRDIQTWNCGMQDCFDPAVLAKEMRIELTPFKYFLARHYSA